MRLGGWTIKEGHHGHLVFIKDGANYNIKDGASYNINYNAIPKNDGFVAITTNGDIWCNTGYPRGFISNLVNRSSIKLGL